MSEMQPCGRWYCQRAPGHERYVEGDQVDLYPRKIRTRNGRRDTQDYDELVEQMVDQDRDAGWSGWIAPEAHLADPGMGDAWHWSFPNDQKYMEAIYWGGEPDELAAQLDMHGGLGWQFPILIVVEEAVDLSAAHHEVLSAYSTPYLVLSDVVEDEPDEDDEKEPPSDDDCALFIDDWIGCEQDLTQVEEVLESAVEMSRTWRGGKHRKALRKSIVKPLRWILHGKEEDE